MKKKMLSLLLAMTMSVALLCGCGQANDATGEGTTNVSEETDENAGVAETDEETEDADSENGADEGVTETSNAASEELTDDTVIRVASLKGPTSIGLVKLWKDAEDGLVQANYEFTMSTQADEILPLMMKGEMDIALVPANAAANLYQKSEGAISVIDINTLGVLYMVSGDTSIDSMEALKGKTVYLTGKGTTPDYVFSHLLKTNGISDDVTVEYKSEATEIAALLAENPDAVGVLPQPFVIAACAQNDALSIVLDVNAEWEKATGKGLITGVTIVRKAFADEHPALVKAFLNDHKNSADYVNANVAEAAELVVANGIVEKAPVAEKAIPKCNITCISGDEMKAMLSEYLDILAEQNIEFIGGAIPAEDFYYAE